MQGLSSYLGNTYHPRLILIDNDVSDDSNAQEICSRLSDVPVMSVNSRQEIDEIFSDMDFPFTEGKNVLYLTTHKGRMLHACPGTQGFLCCRYVVLDLIENCPINCSYCFLNHYATLYPIRVHVNLDQARNEIIRYYNNRKGSFFRLGTGELSDSLALDHITHHAKFLIDIFKELPNSCLELKTKSNNIVSLLEIAPPENVVVSWSLNPQEVIDNEEPGSSSLKQRLDAARMVNQAGYKLAFHFDPIILSDNWQEIYFNTIKFLFESVNHDSIMWISLGGLRYSGLKDYEISRIFANEFISGEDGKYRYFAKMRYPMYRKMLGRIKKYDSNIPVYLCMESKYSWHQVYNTDKIQAPESRLGVENLIQKRIYKNI